MGEPQLPAPLDAPADHEAVRNWFSELLCDTASVLKGTVLTGITGAGTGLALAALTGDPLIAAYTSAAFAIAAAGAHLMKRGAPLDQDGKPTGKLNDVSEFIMLCEALPLDTAIVGACSAPWGTRFLIFQQLIYVVALAAEEEGLTETQRCAVIGAAAGLASIVHTADIGVVIAHVQALLHTMKWMINKPGEWAGTPLRTPKKPMTELLHAVTYAFGPPAIAANMIAIGTNQTGVLLGTGEQSLLKNLPQSTILASFVIGSIMYFSIALYALKEGKPGDRTAPVTISKEDFPNLWPEKMRRSILGGRKMPFQSVVDSAEEASFAKRMLIDLAKLPATPVMLFSASAFLNYHLQLHPLDTSSALSVAPWMAAGTALHGSAWILELLGWDEGRRAGLAPALDALPPDANRQAKETLFNAFVAGGTLLTFGSVLDHHFPDRPHLEFPYGLLVSAALGAFSELPEFWAKTNSNRLALESVLASTLGGAAAALAPGAAAAGAMAGAVLITGAATGLATGVLNERREVAMRIKAEQEHAARDTARAAAAARKKVALDELAKDYQLEDGDEVDRLLTIHVQQDVPRSPVSQLSPVAPGTPASAVSAHGSKRRHVDGVELPEIERFAVELSRFASRLGIEPPEDKRDNSGLPP